MWNETRTSDPTAEMIGVIQDAALRDQLEQGLGDFCHQSRNRLNSLKLSIYLAKRQSTTKLNSAWRDLETDYLSIEAQIGHLQSICQPATLCQVALSLNLLFDDRLDDWGRCLAKHNRQLKLVPPEGPAVAHFDVSQFGQALDLLVRWRAGRGAGLGPVTIRWGIRMGRAFIGWAEPGAPEAQVDRVEHDSDFAWSLPILSRLLLAHRGTIEVDVHHGWALTLEWPV